MRASRCRHGHHEPEQAAVLSPALPGMLASIRPRRDLFSLALRNKGEAEGGDRGLDLEVVILRSLGLGLPRFCGRLWGLADQGLGCGFWAVLLFVDEG